MVARFAKFNLNHRRNFKLHLNFIFVMKIKPMFTFQIHTLNQIDLHFYLNVAFHLFSRFIDQVWFNQNTFVLKRKLNHGPSLPLYFAERILMTLHVQHLHTDNYLDRTFIKYIQNNNSSHDLLDKNCC